VRERESGEWAADRTFAAKRSEKAKAEQTKCKQRAFVQKRERSRIHSLTNRKNCAARPPLEAHMHEYVQKIELPPGYLRVVVGTSKSPLQTLSSLPLQNYTRVECGINSANFENTLTLAFIFNRTVIVIDLLAFS
jgi:hypothetical protein